MPDETTTNTAGAGAAGAGDAGTAGSAGAGGGAAGDASKLGAGAGSAAGAAGLGAGTAGADAKAGAAGADAAKPLELKLPEGFDPKDPAVGKLKDWATKAKLTPEQAQVIADGILTGPELKTLREVEQLTREHQEQLKGRIDALRADPEIGGAKLEASIKAANGALLRFAGPQATAKLNRLFEEKGISNDPDLVRLFVSIGKATSEDSVAGTSGGANGASGGPKTASELAKLLYGEDHTRAS